MDSTPHKQPINQSIRILIRIAMLVMTVGMTLAACQSTVTPPPPTSQPLSTPRAANTNAPTPGSSLDPTPDLTQPVSNLDVNPASLRGMKLRFWHTWTGAAAVAINKLEARFNGTNPWGLWVEMSYYPGNVELIQALTENLGSTSLADVVSLPVEFAAVWEQTGWEQSHLEVVDLSPYIIDPVWGLASKDQIDRVPGVWKAQEVNGRQLGIPYGSSARFFAYNQTWAEELGFTRPPSTQEEFKTQACAAAKANLADKDLQDRGTGGWPIDSDPSTVLSWMAAFEGESSVGLMELGSFNNPSALAAFTYLQDLFDKGCIWTARKSDHSPYLAGRQALLISAGPQDIAHIQFEISKQKEPDTWTLLPFPGSLGEGVLVSSGSALSVIRTNDAHQLAAWLFIRWLLEPRNQAEFLAASYSLPSNYTAGELAAQNLVDFPQWIAASADMDLIQPGFHQAAWVQGRDVVEDAFLQLFLPGTLPGDEAEILIMLEQTLAELESKQP